MSHNNFHPTGRTSGFTLVEMLIVAPIVILILGTFIALVVNMTGEVLSSRSSNVLAYNIQDALTRIEQDVTTSAGFLATNNITLTAPQGYSGGTVTNGTTNTTATDAFHNADSTNGNELILNSYATTSNPTSSTTVANNTILTTEPAGGIDNTQSASNPTCSSATSSNRLLYYNVIYFVKNRSLWRRVIMPSNYSSITCPTGTVPWQQPSCYVGYNSSISAFCKANDVDLVDNVNSFTLDYFTSASSTSAVTAATTAANSDATRQSAISTTNTINATISASQTIAGRKVAQTGNIRVTGINNDTSKNVATSPPTITQNPVNQTVAPSQTNVSFTSNATSPDGTTPGVQWQQMPSGATSWSNISGATSTTYTLATVSPSMSGTQFRAVFTNNAGNQPSSAATLTISASSGWNSLAYQNGWDDYTTTGSYKTGQYMRTSGGYVVLSGMVARTGTTVAGEDIATLPVGYRPSYNLNFYVISSNNQANVQVLTDGEIIAWTNTDAGYVSLDNIKFLASDAPYTWTALTPLLNGWTLRGQPGDPPLMYTTDNMGRFFIQGALGTGGTNTDNTPIVTLPAAGNTSEYFHIATKSGGGGANAVGINTAGTNVATSQMVAKGIAIGSALFPQLSYFPSSYSSSNWTGLTFSNSWTNHTGSFAKGAYTKTADGIVTLKGLLSGGTTTAGTVMATLPAGYRPSNRLIFATICNLAFCRIDVMPNGQILAEGGVDSTWSSIDNISYVAGN